MTEHQFYVTSFKLFSLIAILRCKVERFYLPAQNTKHKVKHEERSNDNKRNEIDPVEETAKCIVRLENVFIMDLIGEVFHLNHRYINIL